MERDIVSKNKTNKTNAYEKIERVIALREKCEDKNSYTYWKEMWKNEELLKRKYIKFYEYNCI